MSCKGEGATHYACDCQLQRMADLESRLAIAKEALSFGIEHAEEGWGYASEYFREKWGAQEGIDKMKRALSKLNEEDEKC